MQLENLEFLKVEFSTGIAELYINRPKAMNALNAAVIKELGEVVDALALETDLRCVILTGAGDKAFVAGADIGEMSAMYSNVEEATRLSTAGQSVLSRLEALPVPVIAAVNGYALGGGCELALACDIIMASAKAKFGQPEVKLGLIPGFGGSVRLVRRIGLNQAGVWIYGAGVYSAEDALRCGLVSAVHAPEDLMPEARKLAQTIARRGPLAVRAAKRSMRAGWGAQSDAMAYEAQAFGALFATTDMKEGTEAFVQKRDVIFTGH